MYALFLKPRSLPALNIILVLSVALLLAGCQRGPVQEALPTWNVPTLPDTAAGRQAAAYLDVFNAGDQEALKTFVADHFTPVGPGGSDIKQRTSSQLRLYNTSHGLNLYQIEESNNTSLTVIAQLRLTQQWQRMTFFVEEAEPHLVSGIRMEPVDAPLITNAAPQSEQQLAEQLDTYISELVTADRFSGVVLVAKDGQPLFQHAYGLANKEQNTANQMATRFDLASTGKMFTAVAIAQLVEQGKVACNASISAYLPEYPADIAERITIEQLLTHRSGLVDYFADEERFAKVKASLNPQRDYPAIFLHEPLRFTPGERFDYSNSNYIVLGAVIERVSGQSYAEYLRTHIFEPAGMGATTLSNEGIDLTLLAAPYTELGPDGQLIPGTRHLADGEAPATGSAAGGAFSTAEDLLKFDQALRSHKLLGPDATEQLLTNRVDFERPGYRYAYGFIVRKVGDEQIVGHSGGFPGVDAQFEMYRDRGYTVIVLSNYELVAESVAVRVQQLLPRP